MARLKAANLRQTTLAQDCPSNATIISVSSSSGFPQPPFRIFVGTNQDFEIMEVTNVNNNTWTVLRAQEGTTAKAWPAGTRVENRFTAGYYSELVSQDELTWDNISNKPSNFPPSSHASSHYSTGNDPLKAQDILALDCEYTSRTIYVDSQYGSDTSGDGSESAPFQTFAKAISTVKQAIADGVTVTIYLKGRGTDYPYTLGLFGRICLGSGQLLIQGELAVQESGNVSSGTPTTITDSSKNWQTNQWAGKLVKIVRGDEEYWRLIYSNTSNTLTVIGRLEETPQSGDAYTVYDWSTFLTSQENRLVMGNVTIRNVACVVASGSPTFAFEGHGSYILDRCWVSSNSSGSNGGIALIAGAPLVSVLKCHIDGSSLQSMGIVVKETAVGGLIMRESWVHDFTYAGIYCGSPLVCFVNNGTIISNATYGLFAYNKGHLVLGSPIVNGEVNKITVANCSYGLFLVFGGSATFTSTALVNYSGNSIDRYSAAYGWYTD